MHPLIGLHLSGNTLTSLDDLAPGQGHLGRPVWNARQLLGDLELRLGLPRSHVSRGLRVQQWSKRLAALVAESQPAPYFAAAYAVDPTGTAAQLLRLRDELVDAGWNGEPLAGAERLETSYRLALLAEPPLPPGSADQLTSVETELRRATRPPYVALDLVDELDLWPGRWVRVFRRLQALGTRIERLRPSWPVPEGEGDLARFQRALRGERVSEAPPAGDGSLVLLRAATSSLLAEPIAALLAADATLSTVVIRGVDPGPLDAALERYGLGRQGVVSRSRWRPALQVLRLALGVAFVPQDPRRVLELLTLGSGPFAGRAGRQLAAALCESPGTGSALWLRNKQELSEEERARIEAWIEAPRLDSAGAPRTALLEVAERVLEWIGRRGPALAEPSWQGALLQAQDFVDALRLDQRERLDRPAVEQLLQDLTEEGSSAAIASEEAGRLDHVDSPERLLAPRDRVVWWGFAGEAPAPRPAFRAAELEALRNAGLSLPDPLATLRARFEGFAGAVRNARQQLVLVIPEQVAGERCQPHPLGDELIAHLLRSETAQAALTLTPQGLARGATLAARLARVPMQELPLMPLPAARHQWHIDPTLIRAREAESASSLEKLMGCPLSWTLHYQAGLRSATRHGIPRGPLLAGKLGHRLFEELHLGGHLGGELRDVRQAAERTLDALIEREAAVLLVAGGSDERNQLRSELIEAAVALAALLREAELELVGVEVPVLATLGGRPLQGSIDLLLRSPSGEERVLDLKYGCGTYSDKLEQGHAVQLAVYAEARRQQSGAQELPPAAYFSLKQQRLLATDAAPHFRRHPQPGPPVSRTVQQTTNTLAAIATTLESGRIPVVGVRATDEVAMQHMLGVTSEQAPEHVTLPAEQTCKYCEFGAVCGRSWEQQW
ncbi:MAG: PD-(D/E)XK nuclease family protein [Polyangiaceae bacterium]